MQVTALRPTQVAAQMANVYAYENPMQGHGPQLGGSYPAKTYAALSPDNLDAKIVALTCHTSQIKGREHTIAGWAGVIALATVRGFECGSPCAEMFCPVRTIL